jgi:malonate transporter and related proteins
MPPIVAALVPVFLMIALGAALRRQGFPGDAFWPLAERAIFYVFFPALLLHNLAVTDLAGFDPLPLVIAVLPPTLALGALLLGVRPFLPFDGPAFTSIFQGALRFNTFVGLGAIATLYGQPGVTLFAIILAFMVPILNVLAVAVLARYGAGVGASWRKQLAMMFQNPLILACLIGIGLNRAGIGLPFGLAPAFDMLGRAALPLGLLAVGAALDLSGRAVLAPAAVLTTGLKLLILPAFVVLACELSGVGGLTRSVSVLYAALPGSSAAYILARQMNGDAALMASIVTLSTVLAFVTLPLAVALLP